MWQFLVIFCFDWRTNQRHLKWHIIATTVCIKRLKSLLTRLFVPKLVQTDNKKISTFPIIGPLWRKSANHSLQRTLTKDKQYQTYHMALQSVIDHSVFQQLFPCHTHLVFQSNAVTLIVYSTVICGCGVEAFLRWWPPSAMWADPLIYLWPPPGMSEWSHLLELGIMCCMLHTFHVSSRIVAYISESSLLLSQ